MDTPVISISPIALSAPGRGTDLHLRVSAPATGSQLPIIAFSHGFGLSLRDYSPLVDFWAAHGFVVIQPTHLDSNTLGVPPTDPRTPSIWKFRVEDMKCILDSLDFIEAALPGLSGRLDPTRIAAVGHSYGAQTAGVLLGARVIAPDGSVGEGMSDPRIKAGVLLCATGRGGADLSPFAAEHFPFMNPSFAEMTTPTLVIAGDKDQSPLTTRGPDWFTDAYTTGPRGNWLVTLLGGEHGLGGISGYGLAVTTDENPDRVAAVQRLSWSYLRSMLYPGDPAWSAVCTELTEKPGSHAKVECK